MIVNHAQWNRGRLRVRQVEIWTESKSENVVERTREIEGHGGRDMRDSKERQEQRDIKRCRETEIEAGRDIKRCRETA